MRALLLAEILLSGLLALPVAGRAASATSASPSVVLNGHRITVEIATTPQQHAHGLMNRTSMPADHGMLFVFADAQPRTFWMKNTLIPLDMVFFNSQRELVAIDADAQPCKADPCKLYPSGVPARYVLELNAGTAARLGMRKGDVMAFSGINASGTQ